MATGPEHYRAAEFAFENAKDEGGGSNKERFFLDAAQFHATMALAAATALAAIDDVPTCDSAAWYQAVGCGTGDDD